MIISTLDEDILERNPAFVHPMTIGQLTSTTGFFLRTSHYVDVPRAEIPEQTDNSSSGPHQVWPA